MTGIPIDKEIAMTGEITLRGNVLPIGGLKEKTLAAHRAGIKRVMFPQENENDIEEIPETVRKDLELIPVKHVDQVIFEGLICKGIEDFQQIIANMKLRDERFFATDKEDDSISDGGSSKVITH